MPKTLVRISPIAAIASFATVQLVVIATSRDIMCWDWLIYTAIWYTVNIIVSMNKLKSIVIFIIFSRSTQCSQFYKELGSFTVIDNIVLLLSQFQSKAYEKVSKAVEKFFLQSSKIYTLRLMALSVNTPSSIIKFIDTDSERLIWAQPFRHTNEETGGYDF